jgi:hypothetical protein
MSQNIISLTFTEAQITALDAALTELETQLSGCIALDLTKKRALKKMGEKSEAFCRQAMLLLSQNPELVPANVVAAGPVQDLAMLDRLRPRLARLTRLAERASDTDIALGSDVMVASLQVYGQLKLTGASEGLQSLRRDLGMRFARTTKPEEAKAA